MEPMDGFWLCTVLLQGVAVTVVCALWSGDAGAAAERYLKVLLACARWCRHAGATAGRRCRVLIAGAAVRAARKPFLG